MSDILSANFAPAVANILNQPMLRNGQFNKLPNSSFQANHQLPFRFLGLVFQRVAEEIGLPFERTGYTVAVKNDWLTVPRVCRKGTQAVIVWGDYEHPVDLKEMLTSGKWTFELASNDKRTDWVLSMVDFLPVELNNAPVLVSDWDTATRLMATMTGKPPSEVLETAGSMLYAQIQVMFPLRWDKEKVTKEVLSGLSTRVLGAKTKSGELLQLLASSNSFPTKLSELPASVPQFTVTGYGQYAGFQGEMKYYLDVTGYGRVAANDHLHKLLRTNPVITPDAPAVLIIDGRTTKKRTEKGVEKEFTVVSCTLTLDEPPFTMEGFMLANGQPAMGGESPEEDDAPF